MRWNEHSKLEGKHAFLSPSGYAWLNYDKDKLVRVYLNHLAVLKGTRLHAFAAEAIALEEKLLLKTKTLNEYVNDAISFHMRPEQPLYYSEKCFGTADAISFYDNFLRIHDLKTGVTKASFKQLHIYAALFCLEYNIDPNDIDIELRIYQSDAIRIENPKPEDIIFVMNRIVEYDKQLDPYWED